MTPRPCPECRWIGGFNLLPWRRGEARRLRRRRAFEWLAAALVGCACAAPLAGWRSVQRMQTDGERRALDASFAQLRAPLAEQRRLAHEVDERRLRAVTAWERTKPLARLFRLLDGVAAANVDGVLLDQVVHRTHETQLHATVSGDVNGEAAMAAWLARLRTLPDVETVSVREMKRAASTGARADDRQHGPLQLTAQLTWAGAVAAEARASSPGGQAGKRVERSVE